MYPDPGWGPAFRKLGSAFLARHKLAGVRPAITAARTQILSGLVPIPILLAGLLSLDAPTDDVLDIWMLVVGFIVALTSVGGVIWVRRSPARFTRNGNIASGFYQASSAMSAFGTAPSLWGFLGYFVGGGMPAFIAGAILSVILLLTVGRTSKSLLREWEERLDPSVAPGTFWAAVLAPGKVSGGFDSRPPPPNEEQPT
jgi:hypothetical protein